MLTLLASMLGFASSALPRLADFWQDRNDRKHELAILDRQLEQARLGHQQRLEEIAVQADIAESQALYQHDAKLASGAPWVDALRASVRPIVTYLFFLLFASVKISGLVVLVFDQNVDIPNALITIWDEETQALFAGIISFWFGSRSLRKT